MHPWCKPLVSLTFFERRWPRSKDGEAKNLLLKYGKKSTPAASEVSIQKNIASAKHAVELGHRSNELRLLHLKMILRIDASPNYFPFHAFPGVDKAAFRCERSYWVDLLCFALLCFSLRFLRRLPLCCWWFHTFYGIVHLSVDTIPRST